MTQIVNFAVNNWWIIIAGIAILPTAIWAIIVLIAGIVDPEGVESTFRFKDFWREIVKLKDVRDPWRPSFWRKILHWLLANKLVVIVNILSLFWAWGYVLQFIGYGIGKTIHWLCRNLWRGLCAIGRGIAAIYRAI